MMPTDIAVDQLTDIELLLSLKDFSIDILYCFQSIDSGNQQ